MMNCPLYDNGLCCGESILITNDGRCFNLIRGFAPDDIPKIKEESIINIEDIEITEENTGCADVKEDEPVNDNAGCNEGTGTD